jgi:hypothetical protein
MKKMIIPILVACIFFSPFANGQKKEKLVPVTRSELTGISLPAGTMQDNRFMSLVTVKTLMEQETKQAGVGVKNPEIFMLPLDSNAKKNPDSLVSRLLAKGWSIAPMKTDVKFAWLKKGDTFVMSYFSIDKKEISLYFAQADGIPTTAGTSGTIAEPTGTKPASSTGDGWSKPAQPSDKPAVNASPANPPVPAVSSTGGNSNTSKTVTSGNFVYTITNFDDGWNSTIAEDIVIVTKGNLRVFIYQSVAHNDETRSAGRNWAWDHIVTRDFNIRSTQYRDHGQVMEAMQAPYIEGLAVEKSSGRNVFIAMYSQSSSGRIFTTLAIAPDEQTFRNAFPKAEDKYESDLNAMRGYNRFAVDARDLTGTWTGGDGSAINVYDGYTGNYLGMNAAVISDKFIFENSNTYSSEHNGATGQVGNMKAFNQVYKGSYTLDKWSISMNNRWKGETDHFHCYFEVVQGGRILHMQNKQYSGIWYHLVRSN